MKIPYLNTIVMAGILDGVQDMLVEAAEMIYSGGLGLFLKFANFSGILNKSYGILPEYTRTAEGWELTSGTISPLLHVASSFGGALALIFMLIGMVDTYMQEKMSIETFVKPFLQYLATVALLLNAEKLIALFWNIGVLFEKKMSEVGLDDISELLKVEFGENTSLGIIIGLLLAGIILFVISLLMGLIIRICAYIANFSRMIEAGVRAVGFPIAIGVAADSSLKQGAIRYLKKFLAVSLQGGMFAAISLIFSLTALVVVKDAATFTQGINQEIVDETSAPAKEALSKLFDEKTGELATDEVNALITDIKSTTGPIIIGESIISSLMAFFGAIVPLIGLGFGSIVVLFKSGQICNDMVGV